MPAWTRGPFGTDGASRGGTTCRPTPDSSLPGSAGVISPRCDPSDRRADAAPSRSPATAESRTDHDAQFVCRRRRSSSAGFSDWSTAGTRRKRAPSPKGPRPPWCPDLRGAQSRMEPSDPCAAHGGCRGWSPRPARNRHCGRCEANSSARVRARRPASSEV